MHHHGVGFGGEQRNQRGVVREVEFGILVERRVDEIGTRGEQERVSIRRRVDDHLGCEVGAGACAVFDDELLSEPFRQPLSHQPRENVRRSAGCKTDDDAHGARGIILRLGGARDEWKRCGARCEM